MSADERMRAALEATAPDLLAYFLRRADRDDAPDLTGEVLLVAWRRRRRAPAEPERLRMWLYGVARNVLAADRRGHVRRSELTNRLAEALDTTREADPDHETRLFVREMLDALPERQREIVLLLHWDGLSLVEAAAHLRITASTARTHYQRARAFLREVLADDDTPATQASEIRSR